MWASLDMFARLHVQELFLHILPGGNGWVRNCSNIQFYKIIPMWLYCFILPLPRYKKLLEPRSLHYLIPCRFFSLNSQIGEAGISFALYMHFPGYELEHLFLYLLAYVFFNGIKNFCSPRHCKESEKQGINQDELFIIHTANKGWVWGIYTRRGLLTWKTVDKRIDQHFTENLPVITVHRRDEFEFGTAASHRLCFRNASGNHVFVETHCLKPCP